jgi:hypothetical protein
MEREVVILGFWELPAWVAVGRTGTLLFSGLFAWSGCILVIVR